MFCLKKYHSFKVDFGPVFVLFGIQSNVGIKNDQHLPPKKIHDQTRGEKPFCSQKQQKGKPLTRHMGALLKWLLDHFFSSWKEVEQIAWIKVTKLPLWQRHAEVPQFFSILTDFDGTKCLKGMVRWLIVFSMFFLELSLSHLERGRIAVTL